MGYIKDFKTFALKGNVIDLAIAVIIGAAFSTIVSSLVEDIITPLLLTPALNATGAADIEHLTWGAVKYGKFLAALIKFIVVALVLFSIIKVVNSLSKKETAVPVQSSATDNLLMEIRDQLKNKI